MEKNTNQLNEQMGQFLDGIAQKTRGLADHIDTQTNILIGVSSAIFLFSLTRILNEGFSWPFFIIGLFSGISAFISLMGVHPPKAMRKQGQKESLLYNKHIANFPSPEDYATKLDNILDDRKEIIHQYATEIYNLSKYYYRPKRKLFHLSRNMLVIGILLALVSLLIEIGQNF